MLDNQTFGDHHWLAIRLIGRSCNRQGIGTTITASRATTLNGNTIQLQQLRQIKGGGSYLSTSDNSAFVGLGPSCAPVTLSVKWPSGTVDTMNIVEIDQQLTILEGGRRYGSR